MSMHGATLLLVATECWHVYGYCSAGFGQMLARPLFRERHRPDMSEEEATQLLHEGLRVRLLITHRECLHRHVPPLYSCTTPDANPPGCAVQGMPCVHHTSGLARQGTVVLRGVACTLRRCATTGTSRQPTSFRLPRSPRTERLCQNPLPSRRSGTTG